LLSTYLNLLNKMIKLLLVSDCPLDRISIIEYIEFLNSLTNTKIEHYKFSYFIQEEKKLNFLAQKMAQIRISNINKREFSPSTFPVEIDYEKNHMDSEKMASSCFYDGFEFQYLLRNHLFDFYYKNNIFVILITEKKLMTWETDNRYHLRSIILGFPCIISRIGIIEAPAKPKEYYFIKNFAPPAELQKWLVENKNNYLELEDKRLQKVIKGYLLQCLYYIKNLEIDFCNDINCALYNSHWQEEVLKAQYNHKLCKRHFERII